MFSIHIRRTICPKLQFLHKVIHKSTLYPRLRSQCIQFVHPKHSFEGPGLSEFIKGVNKPVENFNSEDKVPYLDPADYDGCEQKVYFDVYGCQMNVSDAEIAWSILKEHNYLKTDNVMEADIILLVTCAIRDGAENKVWKRISYLNHLHCISLKKKSKIGILGCMAERLKQKVLDIDRSVRIVCGPDSYKDLPRLLAIATNKNAAINVLLSIDETYADVIPVRLSENSVTAYVSIMRGCDNMCTYCIVPFTRGRERSRPISSILEEVRKLSDQGVKEVTLLGQNVNSYRDTSTVNIYNEATKNPYTVPGFKTVYKPKLGGLRFDTLLEKVSEVDPEMRIRFTSPHPKDFPDSVLHLIKDRKNICENLHLPAQSGNSAVLERMRRGYTRETYLELIQHVREIIPNITLSSDFIAGFCGETEEEFSETLSLMKLVRYNFAYLFTYSMREKTTAHRRLVDDVKREVKLERCNAMTDLFRKIAEEINASQKSEIQLILVEKAAKKGNADLEGRNDGNTKVIIPNIEIPISSTEKDLSPIKPGDYVAVLIRDSNSQVLKGVPLYHSQLSKFEKQSSCLYTPSSKVSSAEVFS